MRLGAVYIREMWQNAFYRAICPMMAMRERGHEVVEVHQRRRTALPIEELRGCDLVHIHRLLLDEDDDDRLERLLDAGVAVTFDDDDNTGAAPPELDELIGEGIVPRAQKDFQRVLARVSQVHLVTTPSPFLAERFEAAGAPEARVIPNYLPGSWRRVGPEGHEGLVIGWHGNWEHLLDARALRLGETIERILDAHDDVHVVTVGDVDLEIEHERYVREDFVPFLELTKRLADVDIGIIPLTGNDFNRGRSNVKAREYAAAGVPWLASPVGPYESLGEEEGGTLVEDDEWFDALDALIGDRRRRRKLAKGARAWAKRETMWQMADVWEQAFRDALERARAAA
jgi:glycosyltransferase involved in cell wall biosynthesis